MVTAREKRIGSVATPTEVARLLTDWAVRRPTDLILDVGTGEGVFTFAAFERLKRLGSSHDTARELLYGAERDGATFEAFAGKARAMLGGLPPHAYHADFFAVDFPVVDAVIGNPPYVARLYLHEIEAIRQRALPFFALHGKLSRLADLYCYFLLYAGHRLRPGGRLAVIISNSWMDVDYGVGFKQWLLSEFDIRAVVSFERRVFSRALVKAVLILAERRPPGKRGLNRPVRFIRLAEWSDDLSGDRLVDGTVAPAKITEVEQERLDPTESWSVYLRNPAIYQALMHTGRLRPLYKSAESRIGLQTLAGGFYILSTDRVAERGIEPEFLVPMAFSPREINMPVLEEGAVPRRYLFACDRPVEELVGTAALTHIRWGEVQTVSVRGGAGATVEGYQNAPRLRRAGRHPWYNIRSEVERRGRWPIMIPRRVYGTYNVVWNQAGWVANEDFIEVNPYCPANVPSMLAALTSSVGEFMIRSKGQSYGGGVLNLNPDNVRHLPVLDLRSLDNGERQILEGAYWQFLQEPRDREHLDRAVLALLGRPVDLDTLWGAVEELRSLSTKSKETVGLGHLVHRRYAFGAQPLR